MKFFNVYLLFALMTPVWAAIGAGPSTPLTTGYPIDTYASLGSSFAQNAHLADLGWTEAQFNAFIDGLRATFRGRPVAMNEEAARLQAAVAGRIQNLVAHDALKYFADPARLEAYMKERVKELHLQRSDTGLAFGMIPASGGSRPGPEDTVVISFKATAADGQTELPTLTIDHRHMPVANLIPGLAEGVQMMNAGSSALFIVPPTLSYGDGEWPDGVEQGTPIIFTVTLHEIVGSN